MTKIICEVMSMSDIPKSCMECSLSAENVYTGVYCTALDPEDSDVYEYDDSRRSDCPLRTVRYHMAAIDPNLKSDADYAALAEIDTKYYRNNPEDQKTEYYKNNPEAYKPYERSSKGVKK